MRVIAGQARRLLLKTPQGKDTRPTTDRIKETLFNMLQDEVPGSRFLDLFAGSGGIGIEALSRGAVFAAFVDNGKESCACIAENLEHTHFSQKAMLIKRDVFAAIPLLSNQSPFDIVFMDPPYEEGLETEVLSVLADSPVVDENTLFIVEASLKTDISDRVPSYRILKEKEYKTNKHIFLQLKED